MHGHAHSLRLQLPPLGVLIFTADRDAGSRSAANPRSVAATALSHAGRRLSGERSALMPGPKVWPGQPYPLGATWDGKGVNFALFSAHAEKVELCLFDRSGQQRGGAHRRCPNTPTRSGTAICPRRARSSSTATASTAPTSRPPATASIRTSCCSTPMPGRCPGRCAGATSLFGYRVGSPREDLVFDRRDSARHMPKCRVVETAFTWDDDRHPRTSWEETIISKCMCAASRSAIRTSSERDRGTFAALASPAVIDYLIELGVTAVELLPIHAAVDERASGRARAAQLLGLQHDRLFRARSALSAGAARSPSSRPRSSACTRPASRSSSTSSTTTPARATSSGRRCRSAASTICRTTGCRTTAASIRTSPAPATR